MPGLSAQSEAMYQTSSFVFSSAIDDMQDVFWGQKCNPILDDNMAGVAIRCLQAITLRELKNDGFTDDDIAKAISSKLIVPCSSVHQSQCMEWEESNWLRFAFLLSELSLTDYRTDNFLSGKIPEALGDIINLPETDSIPLDWNRLYARRSVRKFPNQQISLVECASLLQHGIKNAKCDLITAPYGIHPSLNAYVAIHSVEEIPSNCYLYHEEKHRLISVGAYQENAIQRLIQGQSWGLGGGVSIILTIDWDILERSGRRDGYIHANIAVGELAQSIIECATSLGLGACVTPATNENIGTELFSLTNERRDPIYFVRVGPRV